MVEVCVKPGVPKPWTFHQEIAGLGPRLISRPSASSVSENHYSLDASGKPLASKCFGSSTKPSSSSACLHSRSSSLKSLRTLSSSPDSSESGSSMDLPPRITMMPRYTSSPQSLHLARMSANTRFVDHTISFTNSNAGTMCGEPECIEKACDFQPYTSDPCIERQINRIPFTDMSWASKTMSFGTEEETPSPSSSYDTSDVLKDDPPMWDPNCPYASSNTRSTSYTTSRQGGRYQFVEVPREYPAYTPFPSSGWAMSNDVNPCVQPYIADAMLEPYVEYQNCMDLDWKMGSDMQLQKTFSPPLQSMTYNQQPPSFPTIPSTTTLTSHTPELNLKHLSISANPPSQPIFPGLNPFPFYSDYPADTSTLQDPLPMSDPNTQYTQSPTMPDLIHSYQPQAPSQPPQPQTQQLQLQTQIPLEAHPHLTDLQNAFLIESKEKGLSYKEIKRLGNFKEAESTLRGRFRTLTKRKDQRVRKPKWTERDLTLLCEAVRTLTEKPRETFIPNPSQTCEQQIFEMGSFQVRTQTQTQQSNGVPAQPPKVSWKKVGEYIVEKGGSYQFGNATCKKKWCEVNGVKG